MTPETWYRLGIVVSENSIKKYMDGVFVGENEISGGRWSVYIVFAGGQDQGFLLFSDDDNETSEFYVNAIQLRNYSMNAEEIDLLGSAKAEGIAIGNSGIYNVKAERESSSPIVNWDKMEIYIKFPENIDLSRIILNFDIPYGAQSSIASGTALDLNSAKGKFKTIKVTSEDNISERI